MLFGKITNFSYKKCWREDLECATLSDTNSPNINDLPSKCLVNLGDKTIALSKWVSPKRTRSYPYARVYDTFDSSANKVATIIPLIKDEGKDGDMDYLQWDTISLMSLLNVYVILAFYESAQKNTRNLSKQHKITHQTFNHNFIYTQLQSLNNYHQSALHWNLHQLNAKNLANLISHTKTAYQNMAKNLSVNLHDSANIDKFAQKITKDRESFMSYSRQKAQNAQNREFLTIQPKEFIQSSTKSKIEIENYLGGYYYFTIDEVLEKGGTLCLVESKHSSNAILPSNDDIKDGLLKLMLYNNLCEVRDLSGKRDFKIALQLTSNKLQSAVHLPTTVQNLNAFITTNKLKSNQGDMLRSLNVECEENGFEIWIGKELQ